MFTSCSWTRASDGTPIRWSIRVRSTRSSASGPKTGAEAAHAVETQGLHRIAGLEAERARAEEHAAELERRLQALGRELEEIEVRIGDQDRRSEDAAKEEASLRDEVDRLRLELAQAQTAATACSRERDTALGELEQGRSAALA